jgi:hypothetical protein
MDFFFVLDIYRIGRDPLHRDHRQLKDAHEARLAAYDDWPSHLPWVLLSL